MDAFKQMSNNVMCVYLILKFKYHYIISHSLFSGGGWGTPRTGHQSIPGPTYRQPCTPTHNCLVFIQTKLIIPPTFEFCFLYICMSDIQTMKIEIDAFIKLK